MKKTFFSIKWALGILLVTGFLFIACNKSDSGNNNTEAAGFMAVNLAPDKPSVGVALSGNSVTGTPLAYKSYTGGYLAVYPGTRTVDAFDYYSGNTFASATQTFEVNKYYSAFVVGYNDSYRNIVVNDDLDTLSSASGKAYVRYINAIADSSALPTVTVAMSGTNIINDNASFAHVSDFMAVTPGDIMITVTNGGSIDANRTITLEQNKVYTLLLAGVPGSTGDDKVEIKYIQNGTVDSNPGGRTTSNAASLMIK